MIPVPVREDGGVDEGMISSAATDHEVHKEKRGAALMRWREARRGGDVTNVSMSSRASVKKRPKPCSYKLCVHKVLKQVHADLSLQKKVVDVVDSMLRDVQSRIVNTARELIRCNPRRAHNITTHDIQAAVRLLFPGELGKHAMSEGLKATAKWNTYMKLDKERRADTKFEVKDTTT